MATKKHKYTSEDFKYISNIDLESKEATILLYDQIGDVQDPETGEVTSGIDGAQFAQELLYLETCVDKINIRINSTGGNVLDGFSIISSILHSSAKICTFNDGVAASIAGLILISGDERWAMEYSITMIHNPSGTANNEILDKIKDSLLTILKNNSILSVEELNELMNEETYFNAQEAKDAGLVDDVIPSDNKPEIETDNVYEMAQVFNKLLKDSNMKKPISKNLKVTNKKVGLESPESVTNDGAAANDEDSQRDHQADAEKKAGTKSQGSPDFEVADDADAGDDGQPGKGKADSKEDKETDDKAGFFGKVKAHLGMDEDASEEDCYDSVKKLSDDHADLKREHKIAVDKLKAIGEEAKKAHESKIDAMVNKLIVAKKIVTADIAKVKNLLNADFETTVELYSKVGNTSIKISNVIEKGAVSSTDTSNWTLRDFWTKDKKGIILNKIKEQTPEVYNQLVADHNAIKNIKK